MCGNGLPDDHASGILRLESFFYYAGVHPPGCSLKGDFLQELHASAERVEGEAGSEIVYAQAGIYAFLKIGDGYGHTVSEVLLSRGARFPDVVAAHAGYVNPWHVFIKENKRVAE